MHSEADRPQKIKVTAMAAVRGICNFCPFRLMGEFIRIRGPYVSVQELFFVFKDKTPVTAEQARKLLKLALVKIGLDSSVYDMHSLRIGRASDLIKAKYSIEEVKRMGRWRSNVVYKYIRQ